MKTTSWVGFILGMILMAFGLLTIFKPVLNPQTGLSAEEQLSKIKRDDIIGIIAFIAGSFLFIKTHPNTLGKIG